MYVTSASASKGFNSEEFTFLYTNVRMKLFNRVPVRNTMLKEKGMEAANNKYIRVN